MPAKIPQTKLLTELQQLATELGKTPTIADMKERGEYSERPYVSRFGSWNQALEAADLSVNKHQDLSQDDLLEELQRLADNVDCSPRITDMADQGRYSSQAYMSKFGSWNNALRAAGFAPNQPKEADCDELLNELKRLAKNIGETPTTQDMNEQGAFSVRPYRRVFGSWNDAIKEAGFEPNTGGGRSNLSDNTSQPNKDELKKALCKLSKELDRTPTRDETTEKTAYSRRDFERTFGSFTDACKAADLVPNRYGDLSPEDLLKELHRLQDDLGRTPRIKDLKEHGKYSQQTYRSEFGSWNDALKAAGLEPNQRKRSPAGELKMRLRTLAEELGRTPTRQEVAQNTPFTRQHYESEFGSYKAACLAVDLEPNNQSVTRTSLVSELRNLRDEIGRTPRQKDMREHGNHASSTYRTEFGSWNGALQAAGMKPNQRKDITRQELVEELHRLRSDLDRVPTQADIREHSKFSIRPFNTKFGGTSFAVEAAGMEPAWNNLSRDMLIGELERLGDEVERPPFTSDMEEYGRWGIMAYYREFDSWGEALEKAGFDLPERPHFTTGDYGRGWNKSTKEVVRTRDNKQCWDCGMDQSNHANKYGKRLHVHHITPAHAFDDPERRNAERNLITLCIPCHAKWDSVRGIERVPENVELPEYVSPPEPC